MSDLILLAMDGSPAARLAARAAIQIARERNLLVLGLYVVDEAFISDPQSDIQAELSTNQVPMTKAELLSRFVLQGEQSLQWLEKSCHEADVISSTNILFGGVTETIVKEADCATMVALGRRGHSHASNKDHLGLNFRSIAMHTQKPLLVGGDDLRPIKKVLAALRGGDQSQDTLEWSARLHQSLDFELTILAVNEAKPDRAVERMLVKQSGVQKYQFLYRSGKPADEIVSAAADSQSDLIIMGHYRQSTLDEWLTGSIPDQVLRQTHVPVIIV